MPFWLKSYPQYLIRVIPAEGCLAEAFSACYCVHLKLREHMLQVQNLSFGYEGNSLFEDLSLFLAPNSSTAILGPSGSGKTTLFKILCGLLSSTKGEISLEGKITYMMQQDLLLPWKTAYENVFILAEMEGVKPSKEEVLQLFKEANLLNSLSLYPRQLSAGMRQRVSLIRALLVKRPFLFLDEPFSSVDHRQKKELHKLVMTWQKKHFFTLLLITHDIEEAFALCERVFVLSEGKLILSKARSFL